MANIVPFLAPLCHLQRSFSTAELSVVRLSVRQDWGGGGGGLSQKRFSNFSSFLACSFFGMSYVHISKYRFG